MIQPTVGRIVWFYPVGREHLDFDPGQPLAAVIAKVWSDTCVTLTVFDVHGKPHAKGKVMLWQGDGETPPQCEYATWMPWQKSQAAKTDEIVTQLFARVKALEGQLATLTDALWVDPETPPMPSDAIQPLPDQPPADNLSAAIASATSAPETPPAPEPLPPA